MSGRSAYVRKQITKIKSGEDKHEHEGSKSIDGRQNINLNNPLLEKFPMPAGRHDDHGYESGRKDTKSIHSISSGEKGSYARVRKPVLPDLDVSGIEKSAFREMLDKKSDVIRKGIAGFGKKKKKKRAEEPRPQTSSTVHPSLFDGESMDSSRPPSRPLQREESGDSGYPGPPLGKLPPVPPSPQLRRWAGAGRAAHPWNKLRKDPELWDPHGDTLIFLTHESHKAARAPPSFRVSSHVLEATESKYLIRMLRDGYVDFYSDSELPPSPISSAGGFSRRGQRHYRNDPSSPLENASQDPDGQISYELFFPAPADQLKAETLRYHATTRNVFAVLYQASLVGLNLLQTLNDLHERLRLYMPPDQDSSELVIDYLTTKRVDDVRNDPETAISLLAWSEGKTVHWREGWREFFVHCVGMHNRLDAVPELQFVTPITKALIERASLELEVRVQSVADHLAEFNFSDMWPAMLPQPPPERASFDRLRHWLRTYYEGQYNSWPPPASGDDNWLSRDVVRTMQSDFGALYSYLVDRDVVWDFSDKRYSGKWKIASVDPTKQPKNVDTVDLPMNDILLAYDNRHHYPHIPHPYPLVPDSIPAKGESVQAAGRVARKQLPAEEKMIERKIALAYTEATNIYNLGPDFVSNKLADAFVKFEKNDKPLEVDPFAARRGRWVLIYGILQALASVAVDSPGLRYREEVPYHLNARLRGTPPWKGADQNAEEASHKESYCWTAPKSWFDSSESEVPMLDSLSINPRSRPGSQRSAFGRMGRSAINGSLGSSAATSSNGSDTFSQIGKSPKQRYGRPAGSVRSSAVLSVSNSATGTESDAGSPVRSPQIANARPLRWVAPRLTGKESEGLGIDNGYGPGIEKIDEWPIQEKSTANSLLGERASAIKDIDDYNF